MTTNPKAAADKLAAAVDRVIEAELTTQRGDAMDALEGARETYEAAAKEPEANGWAKKNPWELIADLLGPAEATRIIAQNTPAPEKIVASAEVITLEKIRDTLAREHTAQRLRWNPDVPQWETAYDETMRLLEAAILAQPEAEAVTLADILDALMKGGTEEQYAVELILNAERSILAERAKASSDKTAI